jgi:uroporphyrinogen decarboxylase
MWYHAVMQNRITSRERVLAALRHQYPDRVPFSWGFGPTEEMIAVLERELAEQDIHWQTLRSVADDIFRGPNPLLVGYTLPADTDIWGIRRVTTAYDGGAYGEFSYYPLAGVETVEAINAHPWPNPDAFDWSGYQELLMLRNPDQQKALLITGGNPFEIYCWMTGLEEAIVNLIAAPEVVVAGLEHITGFFETMLTRTLQACAPLVDLVFFADDLGSQTGLLISRAMYREILMPFHCRLTACVEELAPHAARMLHSDGAVFDILPELIEAGFTVFEAVQTDATGMDPQRLKDAFGNALTFHGGISVQHLLPRADADTVCVETQRLVSIFGEGGGYIAAPSHAIQFGTPVENVMAMLRGALGEADYTALLHAARLTH